MAQAQMQKAPAAATKQASPAPAGQPMAGTGSMPPMEGKKMNWWMWLIIAIVVIGIVYGLYRWLM